MRRATLLVLALLATSPTWAVWTACRPLQVSKAATLSTAAQVCVNELGAHASWQCLQGGKWVPYVAVVRWDHATVGMRQAFDAWRASSSDPADMRALELRYRTGNADTSPDLLAVRKAGGYCWIP